MLEKTLESPLDCKEIQLVHPKGHQPWDFFGRNDAKAGTLVLLPGESHGQRSLVGCSPWGHKESDMTERLHFHFSFSCIGEGNGNPLQFLPGESQGRGSLVGCSPWGHYESDTTEQLHFHFSFSCIGEGNGNPLQYSCLENPRDKA